MVRVYGVIGDPVEHSLSPVMQNAAFRALKMDCVYVSFRVSRGELKDFIDGAAHAGVRGINVTLPLKEEMMRYVTPDKTAEKIGAVNTVDLRRMRGYNTDFSGARKALEENGVELKGRKVLLLGAGGAGRAIAHMLAEEGSEIFIANRTREKAISLAREVGGEGYGLDSLPELMNKCEIIINSTSVGLYPRVNESIVPGNLIKPHHTVFDIVYNPVETKLLRDARNAGAKTIDGISMLVHQGAESFRIWTGRNAPVDVMRSAVMEALR